MNWDAKDSALLTAALSGVYADVQSQKDLNARGGKETNPLLNTKPSGQQLDHAGLLAALAGTGTALAIPDNWRKPMLGAWAGLEGGLAYKNAHVNAKEKPTDLAHSHLEGPLMMAAAGGIIGSLLDDHSAIGSAFNNLSLGQYNEGKSTVPTIGIKTDF